MVYMFTRGVIVCNDIDVIPSILTNKTNFPKTKFFHDAFKEIGGARIFGNWGLLNDPGTNLWAAKRRAMDPAFHRNFLKVTMDGMNRVTDDLVDQFESLINGPSVDICSIFDRSAAETVSLCGFGWEWEKVKRYSDDVAELAIAVTSTLTTKMREFYTFDLPWNRKEIKENLHDRVNKVRGLMREHIASQSEQEKEDILSHIIRGNQVSDDLTIEDMIDDYVVFMMAGAETTAICMAMTLHFLTLNPDVMAKARKELDELFGDKKRLSYSDVSKLTYLDMIVRESLRLHPPARATSRHCAKDTTIAGLLIPEGAEFQIIQAELQIDPRYWEDPLKFIPERFATGSNNKIKPFTFMPFMVGPRNCIGKNFAMLEIKVVLARLIHEFDFENGRSGDEQLVLEGMITTRPVGGVKISVRERRG